MATYEFECPGCGAQHGGIISNAQPPPTARYCNHCAKKRNDYFYAIGACELTTTAEYLQMETAYQLKRIADKVENIAAMAITLESTQPEGD